MSALHAVRTQRTNLAKFPCSMINYPNWALQVLQDSRSHTPCRPAAVGGNRHFSCAPHLFGARITGRPLRILSNHSNQANAQVPHAFRVVDTSQSSAAFCVIAAIGSFVRNPFGMYSFFGIQTVFHDIPYSMIQWLAYENMRQTLFRGKEKNALSPGEGIHGSCLCSP